MWAVAGRPLRFGAKVFALQTTLVRIVAGFVGLGRSGGVGVGGGARPWRRACAKQRRGDCGEEIVEARLLQRSWSLRSSWRPSSIFEMEDCVVRIGYEAKGIRVQPKEATRASVAPRRRRACHGGRGQDGTFFSSTRDGALEHAREKSGVRVLQS